MRLVHVMASSGCRVLCVARSEIRGTIQGLELGHECRRENVGSSNIIASAVFLDEAGEVVEESGRVEIHA